MTADPPPSLIMPLLRHSRATLNRWIAQSSAAREQLQELEGHSLIIEISGQRPRLEMRVDEQMLLIDAVDADATADIVIRAGLFELLSMLHAEQAEFSAGEMEFRGSLRTAERFARLLRLARPQLEDELAGWIGGVPAAALVRAGSAVMNWSAQAGISIERSAVEYLQAERGELPFADEVAAYLRDVERLRDDVDRIDRRIERLLRGRTTEGE